MTVMLAVVSDVRFGLRMLLRNRGLSAAAVATLALSIGATSAVFSMINAVMLEPLPYREPERLVVMWGTDKRQADPPLSPLANRLSRNKAPVVSTLAERWRDVSRSFDRLGWYRGWAFNLSGSSEPERVVAALVSADFFTCLGVAPMLGRTFFESEMSAGNGHVVILSNRLWQRRFASDPQTVGKTILLDGLAHTVIGVMPEGFQAIVPGFSPETALWAPISCGYQRGQSWTFVKVIGRLKSGVSLAQAQSEMDTIANGLENESRAFQGRGVNLVRLDEEVSSEAKPVLLIAFGAVGCVLLISCANLAGLVSVRTMARQREFGIRTALGASRNRVVRQLLTECLLLGVIGGAFGLLLSSWIARTIVLMSPGDIPRLDEVSRDTTVLVFTLAASSVAGLLFGLLPALSSLRTNVNEVLKEGGIVAGQGSRLLAPRRLLVVGEIGLAFVLLVSAGLLLRSFALLKAVDLGFDADGLLTMTIPLPRTVYRTPQQQASFAEQLLEQVRTIPSVRSAATSNTLPMAGYSAVAARIQIEGRELSESDSRVSLRAISEGYFRTMGISLLRGRDFAKTDESGSDTVIINQTTALDLWPAENSIGRQVFLAGPAKPRRIIGVVADVKNVGLDIATEREVYVPYSDQPTTFVGLAVRISGNPERVVPAVRAAVRGVDQNQPIDSVATMATVLDRKLARPRFHLALLGSFAGMALILVIVGIYGVVSHSVTHQTRETGIRMALGARPQAVLRMVLGEGAVLAGTGIAIGWVGSFAATGLLRSYLYGIPPQDGLTFAAVSVLLLGVCLAASYFPARRAARMDPMTALRHD